MVLRSVRTGVLTCLLLALSAMAILISHVISGRGTSLPWFYKTSQVSVSNHSTARPVTNKEILGITKHTPDTSISVFVRMSGKRPDHRQRYLCNVFRTSVLFWPPSFGNLVVGLDEESQEDHEFAEKLKTLAQKYFPDRRLEFFYEALPKDKGTLEFLKARLRHPVITDNFGAVFSSTYYQMTPSLLGWTATQLFLPQ